MVDVQTRLADLREEAYAKVLKCLPYPRQWGTEALITGLRNEFGIVDEVHEEILDAVMTNTERPKKRQKVSTGYPQDPVRHDAPIHAHKAGFQQHLRALDDPAESEMIRTGSSGGAQQDFQSRHAFSDKVEQAKQKVKAQKAPQQGHSRFAASAAAGEPLRQPKKRKPERESPQGYAEMESQQALPKIRQLTADEIAQGCKLDPCIGMRVKRLWPDDGGWFEGVVTDFRLTDQHHCITYNFNTADESFEWYDLRNRKQEECKLLKGRVDVLAKSEQPASVKPSSHNGYKAVNKQGSGRGLKKGRNGVAGGRGPHSQRMTSYQPPPPQQQAPVAHRFQVVSEEDDYGIDDISDDGDFGL